MATIKIYAGDYGSRIVSHKGHYRLIQVGTVYAAGSVALCLQIASEFGWAMKLQAGIIGRLSGEQIKEIAAAHEAYRVKA